MAREVRRFGVTIPAGTTKASGFTADLSFPQRVVRRIEIRVPPGPKGEVGFRLGAAGVQVIPSEAGAYVITDDELIPWDLEGLWDSGSWTLFAYNTGRYPHTLEFRFLVDLVGGVNPTVQPIDPGLLAAVAVSGPALGPVALPPILAPLPPPAPIVAAPLPTPPPLAPPVLAPPPTAPPPLSGPPQVTSSVAGWYRELLGRDGDPGGVAYWLGMTQGNGGPLDFPTAVTRFAGTPEAQADAVRAPAAYVAGLYHVLLGRDGAPSEVGYWASRLRGPQSPGGDMTAAQIAASIAQSPEARSDYAQVQLTVVA